MPQLKIFSNFNARVVVVRSPALRDRADDLPLPIDVLPNRIVEWETRRTIRFDSEAVSAGPVPNQRATPTVMIGSFQSTGPDGNRMSLQFYRLQSLVLNCSFFVSIQGTVLYLFLLRNILPRVNAT